MRIYKTEKNEYGWPVDSHKYLSDRGVSCSGTKFDLWFEMSIWNFVARIVNFIRV